MGDTKNVFIAHVHEDDDLLPKLKELITKAGMEVRDGSINSDKPNEAESREYIKSGILAPRIQWASTLLVLITQDTADSWWVNWEIDYAVKQGKNVVGVFAAGATDADIPEALKCFSNRPCTPWGGCGISARTDAGGPMRAYSMDLRERVLLDSDAGMKAADVAAKYRVSGSWVRLLKQRRRETGEVAPRVQRHGRRPMLEPHLHTLAALIAEQPDRTLVELQDELGTPASLATIWRAVQALDITVKKNGAAVRARSA